MRLSKALLRSSLMKTKLLRVTRATSIIECVAKSASTGWPPGTAPSCMEIGGHNGLRLCIKMLARSLWRTSRRSMGRMADADAGWGTLQIKHAMPRAKSLCQSLRTKMWFKQVRRSFLHSWCCDIAISSSMEMPDAPVVFPDFNLLSASASSSSWMGIGVDGSCGGR